MTALLAPPEPAPQRRTIGRLPARSVLTERLPTGWHMAWAAALTTCAALETYSLHRHIQDGTLSSFTRWTFHTHTRAGNLAFVSSWVVFAAWYTRHIARADRQNQRVVAGVMPGPAQGR